MVSAPSSGPPPEPQADRNPLKPERIAQPVLKEPPVRGLGLGGREQRERRWAGGDLSGVLDVSYGSRWRLFAQRLAQDLVDPGGGCPGTPSPPEFQQGFRQLVHTEP